MNNSIIFQIFLDFTLGFWAIISYNIMLRLFLKFCPIYIPFFIEYILNRNIP